MILTHAPETLILPLILVIIRQGTLAVISLLVLLFIFRVGNVEFNKNEDVIVSPAEGVVEEITVEGENYKIPIFLNPINKHFQIVPMDGIIKSVEHIPGEFDMAYNEISTSNERMETIISNKKFDKIMVRQIAGYLFRRIVNTLEKDMIVKKGDFLGLIKFSSKVEVLIPVSQGAPTVKKGDKVNIGDSIFRKPIL